MKNLNKIILVFILVWCCNNFGMGNHMSTAGYGTIYEGGHSNEDYLENAIIS